MPVTTTTSYLRLGGSEDLGCFPSVSDLSFSFVSDCLSFLVKSSAYRRQIDSLSLLASLLYLRSDLRRPFASLQELIAVFPSSVVRAATSGVITSDRSARKSRTQRWGEVTATLGQNGKHQGRIVKCIK